MWKYIVTWCIVVMTSVPKSAPPDEFGRESNFLWYETEISNDCGHERWFNDRAEAIAFYHRAMCETTRWFPTLNGDSICFPMAGNLDKVKIDSIWSYPDTLKREDIIIYDSITYTTRRFSFDSIQIKLQ